MSYLSRASFDATIILPTKDRIGRNVDTLGKLEEMGRKMVLGEDEKKRSRIMLLFMLNLCAVAMGHILLTVYTNGVIRTIERRFSLSSSKTGLLNSCNDIVHICLVIFVGYFGQKYNKPRIICITIMFSAIAGFMMASPHFLFSDYDDSFVQRKQSVLSSNANNSLNNLGESRNFKHEDFTILPNNVYSVEHVLPSTTPKNEITNQEKKIIKYDNDIQVCSKTDNNTFRVDLEIENCEKNGPRHDHTAFYIFVAAQLISGIGSSAVFTLSVAYLDENAAKRKASIYLGTLMGMFSLAPVAGYLLATFTLKFPENLFSGDTLDSSDPSFIGCWWLGYLIGAIYLMVCAIPLWWFPKQISSKNYESDSDVDKITSTDNQKSEGLLEQLKGIPKAFVGLMSNKLFIINGCQLICGYFSIYCVVVNLVRYIEVHFNRTAVEGSIITGGVIAMAGAIGNFAGGVLVSKFKLRAIDGIRLVLFASFIFASGNMILMNLACPQVEMDMNFDPNLEQNTVINDCNKECDCTTNRVDYRPICASNNVSYFSPCMAGCSESVNGTFINCICLKNRNLNNTTISYKYTEGTARRGYCIPPCNLLIPFAFTLVVMTLCNSIARVPAIMINFRIVKDEERSFAIGINSFAINLFAFIPSPLIFGYLIDQTCILWQVTCRVTGACLMFDVARLRYSIFGIGFIIEVINFILNFILFIILRKMALGLSPLARQQIEICSSEVKVEDRNDKSIDDGLKSRIE